MGDNLAQELYAVFIGSGTAVPGSDDAPSWGNLPSLERERWEVVATKARNVMATRFVRSILEVRGNHHEPNDQAACAVDAALDVLRKSWSR